MSSFELWAGRVVTALCLSCVTIPLMFALDFAGRSFGRYLLDRCRRAILGRSTPQAPR